MRSPSRRALTFALLLALLLVVVRTLVLASSGLGLAADEAHYWDWSRHLDWSYPTKGPGIAYAIAGARALLGDQPWMIRTVATASASVAMLLAFALTRASASHLDDHQRARAALYAAVLVALFPAYQVTALLATIDMPYIACWIGACWAGLAMLRRLEDGRAAMGPAIALGLFLGVGFLFKYTILMLLPGLALTLIVRRRHVRCWARTTGTLLAMLATILVCATPVLVWNQREGWPTVAHLLGHLGAPGGDVPTDDTTSRAWTPLWCLEFVGAQLAIAGPALLLMWLGARRPTPGPERAWLVAAALPILVMYLLVSLVTDAEANWPIAGYASLLCLSAVHLPAQIDDWRERVRAWKALPTPRPKAGVLRKKPETPWQVARDLTLGYGLGLLVLLPLVTTFITFDRLQRSERLGELVTDAIDQIGVEPDALVIVTDRYTSASRLAHELHLRLGDGAPLVTSAASLTGDRRSAYDYWPETDPRRLRPGPVLFVGGAQERKWTRRFDTGTMTPMLTEPDDIFGGLYYAPGFVGTRQVPTP
ncbi:MAG: hypothetical protein Tsb0013_15030 [Phycisphaerales bacterium]